MPSTTFTARVTRILATWLQEVNDVVFGLSAPSGSSLAGFIQSGTGAVATDLQARGRLVYYPNDYSTLAQAIAAASGKTLDLLAGTYNFDPSAGITAISGKIRGAGKGLTIINITGSGDVFQRGAFSVFEDVSIQMNGATYSGHCFKIASGAPAQIDRNVEVTNVANAKQAILFEADGGSGFMSHASAYYTLSAAGTAAAIKINGTDSAAVPRKFYGTESGGCTLFDFGGANDFFASGFYTNGLIFGAASHGVQLNNMRLGSAAGDVTIKGSQHFIEGISAANLILECIDSIIHTQAPGWTITDNGTGNDVSANAISYTPTWTGSVVNPALGNGVIKGRYSRRGNVISVIVDLAMGLTTTFGTGAWFFSLPKLDSSSIVQNCGAGEASCAGNTACMLFDVRVEPGLQKCSLRYVAAGAMNNIGAALPGAWANGDVLRFFLAYVCV